MLQNVREQLEESLPGTGGGGNPNDDLFVKFLFLLPPFALLFCYYQSFLQVSAYLFTITIIFYQAYNEMIIVLWI